MSVNFYQFDKLHNDHIIQKIQENFAEIFQKGSFVEGRFNDLFEKDFAQLQQAKNALLVANGTDALEIALKVAGVGVGDWVGVPALTFHATAEAVLNIGALPILIDVDRKSGLFCPESLGRVLERSRGERKLKAILPVFLYGLPLPIKKIEAVCDAFAGQGKIAIIEDAAQGFGGRYHYGPIGSGPHLTTFSFYPTKNLGAFGDAGAICCQDDAHAAVIKSLRNHGRTPHGIGMVGRNSRCDHLQAAVLSVKLASAAGELQTLREGVAANYVRALQAIDRIELPLLSTLSDGVSSWHLFPILLKNLQEKVQLKTFLADRAIQTAAFYERSLKEEIPFQHLTGEFDQATQFAKRVLCLPLHPFMKEDDVEEVVSGIKSYFERY